MGLWVVRSWGGIETDQEGHYDLVDVVAQHHEKDDAGKDVTVQLIHTHGPDGDDMLRRQPHVIAIESARDGEFADDDEGTYVVSEGGTRWHPVSTETGRR